MITTDPLYFRGRSAINLITNNSVLDNDLPTMDIVYHVPGQSAVPEYLKRVIIFIIDYK